MASHAAQSDRTSLPASATLLLLLLHHVRHPHGNPVFRGTNTIKVVINIRLTDVVNQNIGIFGVIVILPIHRADSGAVAQVRHQQLCLLVEGAPKYDRTFWQLVAEPTRQRGIALDSIKRIAQALANVFRIILQADKRII